MKINVVVILILFSVSVFSQTEEIEKKSITQRYQNGEFSMESYQAYAKELKQMITDIGGYPDLPYDEKLGIIKFQFIETTNQSKEVNFKRTLEWAAINFGSLSSVLHYKDFESGKIIIKGYFDVTHKDQYKNFWGVSKQNLTTTSCYETFVFTIKENIIKVDVLDVGYKFTYYFGGYNNIEVSIHSVYPITDFKSDQWKGKIDLLNQTNLKMNKLIDDLGYYIQMNDGDYKF